MAGQSGFRSRVDLLTLIGLGLLLAPLTVMWHELIGHGGACLALGGRPEALGAYYIECNGLAGMAKRVVSMAGVWVDILLSLLAWRLFLRARTPLTRLALWIVGTSKGFVAAGYFLFSGVTNFGDYGPGDGLAPLAYPWVWRLALVIVGGLAYWRILMAASRGLSILVGDDAQGVVDRRRIAFTTYVTFGAVAMLTGLLNPVGVVITVMSAMASSFGGNAGLISIGFMNFTAGVARAFALSRNVILIVVGGAVAIAFAVILGPTLHPYA